MVDIATLGIRIDSRQIKEADDRLDKLAKTGRRTETQTNQIGAAFRRLAAPIAAYLSTRQIAQAAEQWTTLNNRIRLVTDTTQELIAAQDDVFALAQSGRQSLTATAELYQRIATNADALKLSGSGVAAVVDTINRSLAISGTSGASASAALTQLGQAFASGTLRGEELNSVLEQAPALAKAIAEGLGVTTGELRELGQEGVLSAKNVVDALLSQGEAINDQFDTIQATVGQAGTVVGNSFVRIVGRIDDATGASAALAGELISIAEYLDSGLLIDSATETFNVWRGTVNSLLGSLQDVNNELLLLEDVGSRAGEILSESFLNLPLNIKTVVQIAVVEILLIFDRLGSELQTFRDTLKAIVTSDTYDEALARGAAREKELQRVRSESIQQIFDERQAILSSAEAARAAAEEERRRRTEALKDRQATIANLRSNAEPVLDKTQSSAEAKRLQKEIDAANKRMQDRAKDITVSVRADTEQFHLDIAELDTFLQSGLITQETYNRKLVEYKDALDEATPGIQSFTELQEALTATLDPSEVAMARLTNEMIELEVAMGLFPDRADEIQDAIDRLKNDMDDLADKTDETKDVFQEFGKEAARSLQNELADFLFDPFDEGLDGMVKGFARTMQRMVAEAAAAQLLQSVFSGLSNSDNSFFSDIASAFGGARATGGPVASNKAYLVGERGPELFVPNTSGEIVPNHAMPNAPSMSLTQNINVAPTYDNRTAHQIANESARRQRLAQARFSA